ncbi:ester cyclase [Streptomyces sp. MP131-18]|uniref:ester cyclase n=1 Tax=Streptomyces sp. MP131-18 TaxID=1857892 RepID=UPI00097C0BC4|nr:ester cyclase [Streptomyces sp. MP131-18]ONK13000.1 putative ester cyclase [Streptomyces sp. MP131-18]
MSDTDLRDFYHRYVEALNAREFDRMDEFVHESIVMHSEPSSRAALVAQLNSIVDAVPDFHWEVQELAINDDSIAVRAINTGTPTKEWLGAAPTGKSIEIVEYAIYRVRDGKFLHMSAVHDAAALEEQLAG